MISWFLRFFRYLSENHSIKNILVPRPILANEFFRQAWTADVTSEIAEEDCERGCVENKVISFVRVLIMNVIESCVRSGKNETVKFVGGRSKDIIGNILTIREGIFKYCCHNTK